MKTLGILAVLVLAALEASAVNLPRTMARFALDGDLSDPVWTEALRIDQFYELVPGDNVKPPVATTAWVALGAREILVAFRCSDPDPAQLRAPFVARDRVLGDQDFVQIDIDAQDDGASSTVFRAHPRGIPTDGVYTEATRRTDLAPDFEFDTAAKIGADGWTLEMRIPFTALRYPPDEPQIQVAPAARAVGRRDVQPRLLADRVGRGAARGRRSLRGLLYREASGVDGRGRPSVEPAAGA